jgi:hypothetical protein
MFTDHNLPLWTISIVRGVRGLVVLTDRSVTTPAGRQWHLGTRSILKHRRG